MTRALGLVASFVFVILSWSAVAAAEEYPPCDKPPSPDDTEAAKGMHKAAEQYYNKARYDRAIASWKDAYSFDCTAHRLLINVGNAYEKLGNTAKAVDAFEVYVARMGDAADPNIVEKVANLREQLRGPALVAPDPVPDPIPEPVIVPVPDPDGSDANDPGVGPWILLGGGVATAIVGGVLLGVGAGQEADALDRCPDRKCEDPELKALGNDGLNLQIAGGTVLAVGLVAAAGGLVWYLIESDAFGTAKLPVTVNVGATPEFGGLTISGAF